MLRPGQVIILCALALLTIGVVMVNSAGMSVEPVEVLPVGLAEVHDPRDTGVAPVVRSILLSRTGAYMGLAVAVMVFAGLLPVGRLGRLGVGAFRRREVLMLALGCTALLAVLSLAYFPGLGKEVNGSRRWIQVGVPGIGGVSIQPSEIAKWGLILMLACYGAARGALMTGFWRGLAPGLILAGVVAATVTLEDLGTGVLIGAAASVVLLGAGARWWHFVLFVPPMCAGLLGAIITSPYRVQRLVAFLDPYADPQGAGYHMIQSMAAVAGGEGFGRGLGHGLQKFGYLPEQRTDFLFAVLCEEMGIAGAAIVVLLFIAMMWAGLAVVRRQEEVVLKLAGLGVLATVALQALINLAVVTGLGPTKGIALPLVSSGGTGWILTAASLGLLVAMDRTAPGRGAEADGTKTASPAESMIG